MPDFLFTRTAPVGGPLYVGVVACRPVSSRLVGDFVGFCIFGAIESTESKPFICSTLLLVESGLVGRCENE